MNLPRQTLDLAAALLIACCASTAWAQGEAGRRQGEFDGQIRPFLVKYCFDCHSGDAVDGELQLDVLKNAAEIPTTRRKTWKKVHDHLFGHVMPPVDVDQPPEA